MNEVKVKSTIVFKWNYEAIHALNPDGSRKYRYIINEGSSRSSKTRSLIQIFHDYASKNNDKRLSVWRDTKKLCKDTVLMDMTRVFPSMPFFDRITLNVSESFFTFWTKSIIEIKGTDDPDQIHGYNGDVVWVNEPYNISRDTFDQLDQRTSEFMVIDWNPKQDHFIKDLKKDPRTIVIHSTFRNNPYCPPEQKTKILSYQPVSMCDIVLKGMHEQEAKKYDVVLNPAKFSEVQIRELVRCKQNEEKNSANAWNWSVYGLGLKAERPNRILKGTEIHYDSYLKIDVTKYNGVDWGTVDPFGILEAKYYDGGLYLHELNYDSENKIKDRLTAAEWAQISAREEGLVMWLFDKLRIDKRSVIVCDNNRPAKILALREAGFDYAVAASKGTGSIVDGINLLEKVKIYYTHTSLNLKHELENYSRKVDRYGIVLDEPEDINNHLIDPTRYIAQFLQQEGKIRII